MTIEMKVTQSQLRWPYLYLRPAICFALSADRQWYFFKSHQVSADPITAYSRLFYGLPGALSDILSMSSVFFQSPAHSPLMVHSSSDVDWLPALVNEFRFVRVSYS